MLRSELHPRSAGLCCWCLRCRAQRRVAISAGVCTNCVRAICLRLVHLAAVAHHPFGIIVRVTRYTPAVRHDHIDARLSFDHGRCWCLGKECRGWDSLLDVLRVRSLVFDLHTCSACSLKHLCPERMLSGAHVFIAKSAKPAMEPIIVHHERVVDEQQAAIIRAGGESVLPSILDVQSTGPTHSKIVILREARPLTTCVGIVGLVDLPT